MNKYFKSAYWPLVAIVFIFALWLRTVGQNWDEGQGLNPDERFILMVAGSIEPVGSFSEYFDTHKSTLNPHNKNISSYAYGTVPLFVLRYSADFFGVDPSDILARRIAATFDMATLLLLFVICLQFYGRRVAILAAFIYSVSVLPIQLSHFGTFDIHGAFFCTLVLYIAFKSFKYFSTAKQISMSRILLFCFLAGVASSLALATKINLVASFLLFPLSVLIALWPRRGFQVALILSVCYGLLALGFLVLGFRFFQPIAFNGPDFWNFAINKKWWATVIELLSQSAPSIHFPPSVQWIDRTRLHSFLNVVTWGLGLPLGLLSVSAYIYAAYRVLLKKDFAVALPFSWVTTGMVLFALLPETQPMRYTLPVFVSLTILTAILASKILTRPSPWLASRWSNIEQAFARATVVAVLILTTLWALAFVQIYRQDNSRIAASRWIIKNIPGAASFELLDGTLVALPVGENKVFFNLPAKVGFWPNKDFSTNKLFIPKFIAEKGKQFSLTIIEDSKVLVNKVFYAQEGEVNIPFDNYVDFKRGTLYWVNLEGETAKIKKFDLARESSWDDMIPQRIDGTDPYGGIYGGEQNLEIYWSDHKEKAARMAKVLSESEYFYLSSNKQVSSVGRLPEIYPIAAAFYQNLLGCSRREYIPECYAKVQVGDRSGNLGFSLIEVFDSYPGLLGFDLNTQLADQSFQVYDHPKVLLFKNVDRLSADEIQRRITPAKFEEEPKDRG